MKKRPMPDQQRFRNQTTGVGQTRQASENTGALRSQRVVDSSPKKQRRHAVGYPAPTPTEFAYVPPGKIARQTTLR